ncbi:hypothetical protein NEOLEDRAFT_1183779 [Neolentinus lepideus HHB14362 ss-1]|uniref:Uncharacterized protein n=1 Tax=Neolentinus lepideus HHB14362 ss-1 TaxID=1314782 RepID=A0A165MZ66_9AGAM|nr:hypothetical protein NEOLEDRAFT_1183779 [Neolentinus lepideus HHB14362 ss-1]
MSAALSPSPQHAPIDEWSSSGPSYSTLRGSYMTSSPSMGPMSALLDCTGNRLKAITERTKNTSRPTSHPITQHSDALRWLAHIEHACVATEMLQARQDDLCTHWPVLDEFILSQHYQAREGPYLQQRDRLWLQHGGIHLSPIFAFSTEEAFFCVFSIEGAFFYVFSTLSAAYVSFF